MSCGKVSPWTRNDFSAGAAIDDPRIDGLAEKARVLPGPDASVGVEDMVRQRDRGGDHAASRVQFADDRPHAGEIVGRAGVGVLEVHRRVRPAGEHVIAARRVGVVAAGHAPQDADVVRQPGRLGQKLAQLQSGNRGGNRREFAADFGRRLGLGVPRRMLRRTTHQEQDDAVLSATARERRAHPSRLRLGSGRPVPKEVRHAPDQKRSRLRCGALRAGSDRHKAERDSPRCPTWTIPSCQFVVASQGALSAATASRVNFECNLERRRPFGDDAGKTAGVKTAPRKPAREATPHHPTSRRVYPAGGGTRRHGSRTTGPSKIG